MSRVFPQILGPQGTVTAKQVDADLHVPVEEVRALTFGVSLGAATAGVDAPAMNTAATVRHSQLRLVH